LGFFQTLGDSGFDFSFVIGIFDSARQGHSSVVGEYVAIERIQGGRVNIGDQHTFFQVIEYDDAGTTAESTKGFLVELGPDAGTGAES